MWQIENFNLGLNLRALIRFYVGTCFCIFGMCQIWIVTVGSFTASAVLVFMVTGTMGCEGKEVMNLCQICCQHDAIPSFLGVVLD